MAALATTVAHAQTEPRATDNGGNDNPTGVTGEFNGNITTGGSYDAYTGNAKRVVDDIIVPGAVGAYPLKWSRTYDTRGANLGKYGFGVGWRSSYSWGLSVGWGDVAFFPDGRVIGNDGTGAGIPEYVDNHVIYLADGGRVFFEVLQGNYPDGSHYDDYRVSQIVDPYGLVTQISYETVGYDQYGNQKYNMVRVTEPAGRYLQLSYSGVNQNLSSVQAFDPQGALTQSVTYTYADAGEHNQYRVLTRADYSDGTSANYTWQTDRIHENPSFGGDLTVGIPVLQTADDVRYHGPMRQIEYELAPDNRVAGKIKAEKKMGTGEAVSTLAFTDSVKPGSRVETRGDGQQRTFYGGGRVSDYTDFTNGNWTHVSDDGCGFVAGVRDARNNTTGYTRDCKTGQITQILHPGGAHSDYVYSTANPFLITSKSDERQNITYYDRDANGRIYQIRYPDGASEGFDYNGFGQVTRHRLKSGNYQHFEYDGNGRLLKRWNPTSNPSPSYGEPFTSFEYYPSGHPWADRVWLETDPRGNWTAYEYDVVGNQPVAGRGLVTRIAHGADNTYQSVGYDQFGNKLWEENELRQRTTYAYDDYNRPLTVTPPLPAQPATYTYEPTFGVADPYLHTTQSVHLKTDGAGVAVENKYDENFRLASSTQRDGNTNPTTYLSYDPVGNLSATQDPRGNVTRLTYDGRNRKETSTNPAPFNNEVTRWGYDATNNVTSILRPDNQTERKAYDAMNRVTQHVEPIRPGVNKTTRFDYWLSGQLYQVTDDNGQITRFDYDASDLKTRMTYPDNSYQEWAYDQNKNLTNRRTLGGKNQSFFYDGRNRQTNMRWDSAVDDWADFGYDAANHMTSANNGYAAVTRTYDTAGRMILEQSYLYGLEEKDVQYNYDGAGKQTNLALVGTDYQFHYTYDAIGRFSQIVYAGAGATNTGSDAWFQYTYDEASHETERLCAMNGVAQRYDRDELGRLRGLTVQNAAAPTYGVSTPTTLPSTGGVISTPPTPALPVQVPGLLAGLTNLLSNANGLYVPPPGTVQSAEHYGYDAMNRLTSTSRDEDGGRSDSFSYDYSGQLTNASYAWNGRNMAYALDNVGNRTQTNDNGNLQGYIRNPSYLNQYTSAPAGVVANGAEHEITGYAGNSYSYYGDRRLASVSGNGHYYYLYYDALGRCVARQLDWVTTYYTYDGEKPIYEWQNGQRAGWNLYGKGIDEILLRSDYVVVPNGQGYFYQQDHEGSVTHLMSFEGTRIESYRYDAFGAPTTTYSGGSFRQRQPIAGAEPTGLR